ncbi:hypothetical protein [Salisediminibacterium selenitireducens]|uniref:Uncharacterized protein n=1 Tax=Bacillus selenitireducens (strain ATCC 700615 / DSM 15326 / MLS10) TaxID=439292 RepID=D6XUU0_BACIE|nr:hypothetical protein [Salisediminibacterium selenitireducens]ADH99576.1 hypothetical protein Bsel_2072 [[Bacillus] selenitireducens MLS10]
MKSGLLIAAASVLMITVWGAFFYVFFSQPEPSVPGYSQPERETYESVRFVDSVNTILAVQEDSTGDEDTETVVEQQPRPERRYTKDPSEYPDIRDGDAIGYGDGVSVDDLLLGDGSFEN